MQRLLSICCLATLNLSVALGGQFNYGYHYYHQTQHTAPVAQASPVSFNSMPQAGGQVYLIQNAGRPLVLNGGQQLNAQQFRGGSNFSQPIMLNSTQQFRGGSNFSQPIMLNSAQQFGGGLNFSQQMNYTVVPTLTRVPVFVAPVRTSVAPAVNNAAPAQIMHDPCANPCAVGMDVGTDPRTFLPQTTPGTGNGPTGPPSVGRPAGPTGPPSVGRPAGPTGPPSVGFPPQS